MSMNGKTPDFLLVGAMKGGTTTLYYDLGRHPDLHLPENKEPEILVKHAGASAILAAYARHFRNAGPDQLCGEASTAYTKRPDHEGVAERARAALGPDVRIIYIKRDPVARAMSHFRHDRQHGEVSEPFTEAVRNHRRYVHYGSYDWQIAPWRAAFGADHVLEIELEDYTAHRQERLDEVLRFLGADPARLGPLDPGLKANSADEQKAIANPLLRAIIHSDLYQNRIKRLVPRGLRERARRAILPEPEKVEIDIPPETREFILRETATGR